MSGYSNLSKSISKSLGKVKNIFKKNNKKSLPN